MAKKTSKVASPTTAAQTVTLPAIEIQQGGIRMYAFVAQSDVLRSFSAVSLREDDSEEGFQRHLKEARLRQIARYIDERRGVIPNNIIIDFFSSEVLYDPNTKTITIPVTKKCAWIIDGQHRLFGFKFSKNQYPLLVIGFLRLKQDEKVKIFVTINTEQKKLPTSLCLDLLNIIGSDEDINTRCRELVASLNEEEESPWYDQVNMTGEGVGHISLVNFVRKVKPLISSTGVLKNYSFQQQFGILSNYWSAVKAVYADQWGRSLITKTVGFGALMNFFPTVFTKTLGMKGEFTINAVVATFSLIKDVKFDSESFGGGTGNKAEMSASDFLNEELERALNSSVPDGAAGVLKL